MAKTIAVFCDGTWNSNDMEETTNVDEIFRACLKTPTQIPVYIPGVGTSGAGNFLRKQVVRIGGGAFGWGLNGKIRQAYRVIAEIYEPNDIIMIFGFSRGAYTARSLAGMIRKCGIVPKDRLSALKRAVTLRQAFALYKRGGPENAPDAPHIIAERAAMSPNFATSETDRAAREDPASVAMVNIAYLGVWDTVGALGLPEPVLGPVARWWNKRYGFHDTKLSSMVKAARHGLALDERRKFYREIPWSNLDPYREGNEERLGLNAGTKGADRPYQQKWFIGNHGVIGGSSAKQGLVAPPRDWVVEGAIERGLLLDPDARFAPGDVVSPEDVGSESRFYKDIAPQFLEWRAGPDTADGLHHTVTQRVQARAEYRPRSLMLARADLFPQTLIA